MLFAVQLTVEPVTGGEVGIVTIPLKTCTEPALALFAKVDETMCVANAEDDSVSVKLAAPP